MTERTERRAHPRIDLAAVVQLSCESGSHVMETLNIGRGGLFLRGTPSDYPDLVVGSVAHMALFDGEAIALEQDLVIVRVEKGQREGFGAMFVNTDAEGAASLERFLVSKGYPAVEQRAHPRLELLAQVQVTRDSECHVMETLNISRGGMFLLGTPDQYPDLVVGTAVELLVFSAEDPEGEDLALEAEIVRLAAGGRPGFGAKFINVDLERARRLDRFLSRIAG